MSTRCPWLHVYQLRQLYIRLPVVSGCTHTGIVHKRLSSMQRAFMSCRSWAFSRRPSHIWTNTDPPCNSNNTQQYTHILRFCRATLCTGRPVLWRGAVCLSRSCILSKRGNVSSNFVYFPVSHHCSFLTIRNVRNTIAKFWRVRLGDEASNAGVVQKIVISTNTSLYLGNGTNIGATVTVERQ